jgi:dihydropyrimidinase
VDRAELVLKNGLIVTPTGVVEGGVAVSAGRIIAVGRDGSLPAGDHEIDLGGKHVLPGVVDPEAHLGANRPLAADFASETRAAAAAGVTTWGLQLSSLFITGTASDVHGPEDIPGFADAMPTFYEAGRASLVDYFLTPIVTTDRHVAEIPDLASAHGVTSYKFHLNMGGAWRPATPAYAFDDGTVYSAFEAVAGLGAPGIVLLHCENWQIARVLQQRLEQAGRTDMGAWDDRSPWFTEAAHARAYLYYAKLTGCPTYIVHVTCEQTIEEMERARAEGVQVTGEIGSHYLVLDKTAWKINVPLRDRSTHDALWRALAEGRVDCIGSDHVAHGRTRESMDTGSVWTTVSGFPSRIEGMLPLMLSEGVNKGRITIEQLARVSSENPARIFGLYPKKGAILVGSDADLVVVDLQRRATMTRANLHTATPWTIYEGWDVTGWPVRTIRRGETISEWPADAARPIVSETAGGQYLARTIGDGNRS